MRIFTIITLLLFISFSSKAQSPILQKEVKSLFENKHIQTSEYYGYINDEIEFQFYLAYDKDEWKGIGYYPSSQTKIFFEGGMVKSNLILDEIDQKGDKVGMWSINMANNEYKAKWMNISGNNSLSLNLKKLNKTNKNLEKRFAQIGIYEGSIKKDNYSFTIYKYNNKILYANIVNNSKSKVIHNNINCIDNNCDSFEVTNFDNFELKKLKCFLSDNYLNIKAKNELGTHFTSKLARIETLDFKDISYINNKFFLNISHPKFKDKNIYKTFLKELEKITDSLKIEMERINDEFNDVQNRFSIQSKGWFDVDYYSKDFFSGVFIIQKSYEQEVTSIPIIFSLKMGKKINIFDQFDSDFNAKFFFEQYLKDNIKKMPAYRSTLIRNYLNFKNFKNLTINNAGLVFSTDFNSIFGIYKIILPYSEFKNKLKRKSILKKIMEQ